MTHLLNTIVSFVSWHRRAIGALLATAGVLLALHTATAGGETVPVTVLGRDVSAGEVITAADLTTTQAPPGMLPATLDADAAAGQLTAISLAKGTPVQASMLVSHHSTSPGRAIVPVTITDTSLRALLQPGTPITLVMTFTEQAEVLTNDARVAALPASPSGNSGLGSATGSSAGVVLVEVSSQEAPTVAALGQAGELSIILGTP